ncbi:hypothetical protein C8R43DRAFT_965653, partial [Mycena crocata]
MSGKTPKPATSGGKRAPSAPEVARPPPDYFTFLRQLPSPPGVFSLAHPASLDEVSPSMTRTVFTPDVMKILVENSKWLQQFAHLPDFPPQILYLHSCMGAVCAHIDPRNEHPEWKVAAWDIAGGGGEWPGAFELPPKPAPPPPPPVSEKKKKRPVVAGPTPKQASGSGQAASDKKRKRVPSSDVASRPAKVEPSSNKPAFRKKIQPVQAEVIEVDDSPAPESPPGKRQKKKSKGGVKSDAQVRDDSEEPALPVASGPAAKPPKNSTKGSKGKGKAKEQEPEVPPVFEAPEGIIVDDAAFTFADLASGAGSYKKVGRITALQHPDPKADQLSDPITSRQIYTHYNKHSLSKEQREALFKILPAGYSSVAQPITTPDGEGFKIAFSDIRRGKGLKSTKESPRCIECISSGAPCATVASGMVCYTCHNSHSKMSCSCIRTIQYKDKAAPEYLKWIEATPFGLKQRFDSLCQAFENVTQVEKIRLPLQAQFDLQMLLYLRDILRLRQTCQTFEEFIACFRSGRDCEAILRVAMVQMLDARSEPNQNWVWYFFQDEWLRDPIPNYKSAWDFTRSWMRRVGRQTEPRGFFLCPGQQRAHVQRALGGNPAGGLPGRRHGPICSAERAQPHEAPHRRTRCQHGKSDLDPTEGRPPRCLGSLRRAASLQRLPSWRRVSGGPRLLDLEADEASDDHES